MSENKLQMQPRDEASEAPEQTYEGRVYVPHVDIYETDEAITVIADMPGVDAKELTIDLRENTLSLFGKSSWSSPTPPDLVAEFEVGSFARRFNLSNTIDQAKIDANLKNGVLTLTLPKVEAHKPRQIEVKAS